MITLEVFFSETGYRRIHEHFATAHAAHHWAKLTHPWHPFKVTKHG
jgi:hypothetical protein